MKIIKKYGWGFWIGLSLALIGFPFYTWEYWFVLVPTILLVIYHFEED